jgi:hypothetical protein
MAKRLFVSLFILVSVVLIIPQRSVIAKGPVTKIIISGPGIDGNVEVTDMTLLAGLSLGEFELFNVSVIDLPSLSEGYEIARYMEEPGQKPFHFDDVRYFPSSTEGKTGYLYFVGIVGGQSEYDGRWYYVSERGEAAMHKLLKTLVRPKAEVKDQKSTLAKAPSECKSISNQTESPDDGEPAVEVTETVWLSGFQGQPATLKLDRASNKRTEHGWTVDLHWLIKKEASPKNSLLSIWGHHVENNHRIWFSLSDKEPTAVLVIIPSVQIKGDWVEIDTKIYVPEAGCYQFEIFTAGKKTPSKVSFAAGS